MSDMKTIAKMMSCVRCKWSAEEKKKKSAYVCV
jgi:hypothetical protein